MFARPVGRTIELSVVIPTIGRPGTLAEVLDRLGGQAGSPGAFEVIVVTDADEPDPGRVSDLVGQRPYPARHLRGEVPGAAGARNRGWRAAEGPIVLFVDDDVLPRPRLVAEHLAWHAAHPAIEVGVLGHVRWARSLRVTPFMRWLEHGVQFDYPNIRGTQAGWGRFYTANVSVKAEVLRAVGGFDERRFPFGLEDLDLAYRMDRELGFRLLYNARAVAEHLHRMDLDMWRRRVRRIAAAERDFAREHPEVPPHFRQLLGDAAARPPARGRGRWLLGVVPRSLPGLGDRVWRSADLYYRQQLAGPFLEAWEQAAERRREGAERAPDLSERSRS
jgi:GT2 family glycosyltransferase